MIPGPGAQRHWSTWRGRALLSITIACLIAAVALPAMPQPLSYHAFADCRTLFGVANFFNVGSNLPFLVAGAWGLGIVLGGGGQFLDPREQLPYLVFFLGALLTCFGSAYYHLAPDNTRLVWDRLPMTLGFSGLVAAALAERFDFTWGLRSLWPLLLAGVITVLYWYATERAGAGNVMPYGVYQGWSVLVIVLLITLFPATRYTDGKYLAWAAVWYGLAKVFETFDLQIYRLLGGWLSGHSIKHVLAALGVFAIVWQLRLRQPVQRASIRST
ncbi:MAG TPA: hypothetical protein VF033_15145 [Steroidobacteraceae bacterium]|jgi:hypothetical protein